MYFENLQNKILSKEAIIGIIGLGYIGLPLGLEFVSKGFNVIGFDIDEMKIRSLNNRKTYIKHICEERIKEAVDSLRFTTTTDFTRLTEVDAILICVPTPLNDHREPEMKYIRNTAKEIQKYRKKGQLISLESTTYPGTTEEMLLPMFEDSKFRVGEDYFLAYSPEREDPNNSEYTTSKIPKVVSGITEKCKDLATLLYNHIVLKTIPVSSTKTAEATKLLENIYRSVNIALVNELKMVYDKMGIDIWEVIEAASTKPFGYSPFYPGPGLGGHCIPIDPFYLTWKAREYDVNTKFIELAGEINTFQPYYIVEKTIEALNKFKKPLDGSKVLILGAAYKKDIDDLRESPSLKLIEILKEKGAVVDYNDPFIQILPETRKYKFDMRSVEITEDNLRIYDAVIISTDHSLYNYEFIADKAMLIIDTRNVFGRKGIERENIIKG